MGSYIRIEIGPEDTGKKVYTILRNRLGLSASRIRSVKFEPEGLKLNGVAVTTRGMVSEGDVLEVLRTDSGKRKVRILPNPGPLTILYEDEYLIAVDKPAGTVSHPSKGHLTDSLSNALAAYFFEKGENAAVHLAGRLDKDTSGVLLAAKDGVTAERLRREKEEGKIRKSYLAAVYGKFPEKSGTVEIPMRAAGNPDGLLRMKADTEQGRYALTRYEVIREGEYSAPENSSTPAGRETPFSLLRLQIPTGRTHQIRFHMAAVGHPLLGDRLYGKCPDSPGESSGSREAASGESSIPGISRTLLHAETLTFSHPYTGTEVRIRADIPEDLKNLIKKTVPFSGNG